MDTAPAIRNREPVACVWCGAAPVWESPREHADHEKWCARIEMGLGRAAALNEALKAAPDPKRRWGR